MFTCLSKVQFEPGFDVSDHFLGLFAEKLKSFAAFNGCDAIKVEDIKTKGVVRRLRKRLK